MTLWLSSVFEDEENLLSLGQKSLEKKAKLQKRKER